MTGHLNGYSVAGDDRGFGVLGHLLHVVRHVGVGRHHDHLRLQAVPGVFLLPGAVELGLDAGDVVGRPVVDDRGELRLRAELDHFRILAEGELAALGGDLHRSRRVGVLHDHVGALVEQRLGGVGFLAGIEPGVHPDDLDLDVGIDGLRAEHRGVDAHDDFGDRERADIAEHAGLRHLAGDHALDVTAFVEPAVIDRHVLVFLEAGGVLEMHVRIFLGDLQRRVHVAERGGEDQLVAGAHELLDGALGVGTLRHVFEIGGLDLVAELLDHRLPRDLVLVGPAEIADRAEVDEPDLQFVVRRRSAAQARRQQDRGRSHKKFFPHHQSPHSRGEPSIQNAAPHHARPETDISDRARTRCRARPAPSSRRCASARSARAR